ncbi:UDP-glucose 4-epimerase [Fusobacterium periodonticum]|nr:UDP-glucose 4-epimerase [Fusobacterium periodonticum]
MTEEVLVTGGAGYIGSHAVVELLDKGYSVIVVDNLENGFIELVDKRAKFYQGDIRNQEFLEKVFLENKISTVMHFAGYIKVGESIKDPIKYYENNTFGTLLLLKSMLKNNIKNPINPYGKSKLMAEDIIIDFANTYDFNYVIFRYFNVAGAHKKYDIGQKDKDITSLIALVLKVASGEKETLEVYGNDYPTKDGTGVRDYIHVVDLVKAHVLSLNILKKKKSSIYNLGNGFSVFDVIKTTEKVTNKKINYKISPRRKGDPAIVVASSTKAEVELGWKKQNTKN